jgi:hypothetical protein
MLICLVRRACVLARYRPKYTYLPVVVPVGSFQVTSRAFKFIEVRVLPDLNFSRALPVWRPPGQYGPSLHRVINETASALQKKGGVLPDEETLAVPAPAARTEAQLVAVVQTLNLPRLLPSQLTGNSRELERSTAWLFKVLLISTGSPELRLSLQVRSGLLLGRVHSRSLGP